MAGNEQIKALSPKQIKVITALLKGATVTDATREAEVDRTTYYAWLRSNSTFAEELSRRKEELRAALDGAIDAAWEDHYRLQEQRLRDYDS